MALGAEFYIYSATRLRSDTQQYEMGKETVAMVKKYDNLKDREDTGRASRKYESGFEAE